MQERPHEKENNHKESVYLKRKEFEPPKMISKNDPFENSNNILRVEKVDPEFYNNKNGIYRPEELQLIIELQIFKNKTQHFNKRNNSTALEECKATIEKKTGKKM